MSTFQRASETAAELCRELETQGQIAGICLSRLAALLTRNREHFERVPALGLADF